MTLSTARAGEARAGGPAFGDLQAAYGEAESSPAAGVISAGDTGSSAPAAQRRAMTPGVPASGDGSVVAALPWFVVTGVTLVALIAAVVHGSAGPVAWRSCNARRAGVSGNAEHTLAQDDDEQASYSTRSAAILLLHPSRTGQSSLMHATRGRSGTVGTRQSFLTHAAWRQGSYPDHHLRSPPRLRWDGGLSRPARLPLRRRSSGLDLRACSSSRAARGRGFEPQRSGGAASYAHGCRAAPCRSAQRLRVTPGGVVARAQKRQP
jgi:hypothetical protein